MYFVPFGTGDSTCQPDMANGVFFPIFFFCWRRFVVSFFQYHPLNDGDQVTSPRAGRGLFGCREVDTCGKWKPLEMAVNFCEELDIQHFETKKRREKRSLKINMISRKFYLKNIRERKRCRGSCRTIDIGRFVAKATRHDQVVASLPLVSGV